MSDTEEITTAGAARQLHGQFQTPEMLAALQSRLGALDGQPSDYINSLPANVRARIDSLKNLQAKNSAIEIEFQKEVLALEKKYLKLHQPIYNKRHEIIVGSYEPTEEECIVKDGSESEDTESKEERPKADPSVKGIPAFWLTCLQNLPGVSELITDADIDCLKHLVDIKYHYLDTDPGFALEFVFEPNDYFTNTTLVKTYHLIETEDDPLCFDSAEGTKIDWKEGKDLSVKIEIKKQRHKTSNKTRTVKKSVPCDTFFNFFSPMTPPEDQEEMNDDDYNSFETDYEFGEMIKEKLIPEAIDWFTGKALAQFQSEYDDDEDEGYDFDDEDDEDEDEDDDQAPAAQPQECKQQ
ncbi:hypothetical protein BC833DRAFT_609908 [Globomyces pollinis-pini]|nr:hypothetical protein BC833DRAFT_609908 [Globomyces pollinis-pini]